MPKRMFTLFVGIRFHICWCGTEQRGLGGCSFARVTITGVDVPQTMGLKAYQSTVQSFVETAIP